MLNISKETYKKMKRFITKYHLQLQNDDVKDSPYIKVVTLKVTHKYNPDYGDERVCVCGHPYHRHFDSYEDMYAIGCKYCACYEFKEDKKQN